MRILSILRLFQYSKLPAEKREAMQTVQIRFAEDTNSDSLFDNTDPDEEVTDGAPTISNADAWCYEVGGTTEGEQWGFKFSFDDPQGVETVPPTANGEYSNPELSWRQYRRFRCCL